MTSQLCQMIAMAKEVERSFSFIHAASADQGNNRWVMDSDSDPMRARIFFLVIMKDTFFN